MKKILSFLFIILISFSNIAYAKEFVATSEYDAYNKALVYLGEVAYGNEFVKAEDKLRRFEKPINIFLQGKLTKEDEAFAKQFVADLNRKVPRMPLVSFTKKDKANVIVSYVPLKDMKKYSPYYVENNWGFASYWWNNKSEITKIEIAIAIDVTNQKERNHLFMEEILNSFACPNDSYTYSDSIFYQNWTTTQEPSEIDWICVNMVYSKRVKPGMKYSKVVEELKKDMPRKN